MIDHSYFNPVRLKANLVQDDGSGGLRLRPSLVTSSYSGGVPASAADIKPGIVYPDGRVREGRTHGNDLRSTLLKSDRFAGVFDGTAYAEIPHAADLSFGDGVTDSPFSISAWVYPTADDGAILSKVRVTGGTEMDVRAEYAMFNTGGNIVFDVYDVDTSNKLRQTTDDPIPLNQWSHIVGSYAPENDPVIMINGSVAASSSGDTGTYVAMHAGPSTPVRIGSHLWDSGAFNRFFSGRIYDVRVWPVALAATNAAWLFDGSGDFPSVGSLRWYEFAEGAGTDLSDSRGVADITFTNGSWVAR